MFHTIPDWFMYWVRAWGSTIMPLVEVLGILGVVWSLGSPLTEYATGRIQKQTHKEAWDRAKRYFVTNTRPPLITIAVLFILGLIFIGPYQFDKNSKDDNTKTVSSKDKSIHDLASRLTVTEHQRDNIQGNLSAANSKPQDPRLTTLGNAMSMVSNIRQALQPHKPISIFVSAAPENNAIADDLIAVFLQACGNTETRRDCSAMRPFSVRQPNFEGMVIHVTDAAAIKGL
jgi:hypothetical protein